MAYSETSICNMALARIGAARIDDFDSDATVQAIQCRLHYSHTRDALIRSHFWRCGKSRATLSQDSNTPDFQWDYQYDLPNDFLRMISVYGDTNEVDASSTYGYTLEGKKLLTNEDTCQIRYIRQVTDPTEFDPLFVEVLVLTLASKLIIALAQDYDGQQKILLQLAPLLRSVRAMDREETDTMSKTELATWNDARLNNNMSISSRMG